MEQSVFASEWELYLESISASQQLQPPTEFTKKQQTLLDELRSVVSQEGIEISVNPILSFSETTVLSLDVEHDESGGFIGCGIMVDGANSVYYYSDLAILCSLPFSTFSIIAHNGVSDMEMLRFWGINVRDTQLVWDTMLVGHLLDSSLKSYGLKDMAKRELGISYPSYDDIVGKRGLKAPRVTLDKQPIELVALYNAMDTYTTYRLYEKQKKAMGL